MTGTLGRNVSSPRHCEVVNLHLGEGTHSLLRLSRAVADPELGVGVGIDEWRVEEEERSSPPRLVGSVEAHMEDHCPLPQPQLGLFHPHHLLAVVSFRGVVWALVQPVRRGCMELVRTVVPVPEPGKWTSAGLAEREQLILVRLPVLEAEEGRNCLQQQ